MTVRLAVFCVAVVVLQHSASARPAEETTGLGERASNVLDRFFQSGHPRLVSYRARRLLEASSMSGRMSASLDAWTFLDPDGTFRFEIVHETGSAVIRQHVLIAALCAEQRGRDERELRAAELTSSNYDFHVSPSAEQGRLTLGLIPKRHSPMLVDGAAVINAADADLVRIEGRLAQPPSYWTRQVDIVRRYARIDGVRVAVEMRSRAEVRIAGESSFSMTYRYAMINGRAVEYSERSE